MNHRTFRFRIEAGLVALALAAVLPLQAVQAQPRTTASSASAAKPNAARTPAPVRKQAGHPDRRAGVFERVSVGSRSSIDSQMSVQSRGSQASVVLDRAPATTRDISRATNSALGRTTRQVTFNYARMPVVNRGAGIGRLETPVSTSTRASIGPTARPRGGFPVSRLKSAGRAKGATSRSGRSAPAKGTKGKKRK